MIAVKRTGAGASPLPRDLRPRQAKAAASPPHNVYLVIIDERRNLATPYYQLSKFARFFPKIISRHSSGRLASSISFRYRLTGSKG